MLEGRFDAIASSPAFLAEVQAALPGLRRDATWGASPAEIMAVLSQRFAVFPQPDRSDSEWAAWWSDYTNALDDIPPSAIEAGMAAYVKGADSEFFPKPGRIRELAKTVPNKLAAACETAQRAIRHAQMLNEPGPEATPPKPVTESDRAEIQKMVASYNKAMADRAPLPKPSRPPTNGPVDEQGLTQAMRDHMRGQP